MSACPHCGMPVEIIVVSANIAIPQNDVLLALTPIQRLMFKIVKRAGAGGIGAKDIFDALYEGDANGGPDSLNVVHVQRVKMNERLQVFGLKITTERGHGSLWRLKKTT